MNRKLKEHSTLDTQTTTKKEHQLRGTNLSQITNKLDLVVSSCGYIRTEEFDPVIMCFTNATNRLLVDDEPMLSGIRVWVLTVHGKVVWCEGKYTGLENNNEDGHPPNQLTYSRPLTKGHRLT
jgi:hypothetical protein